MGTCGQWDGAGAAGVMVQLCARRVVVSLSNIRYFATVVAEANRVAAEAVGGAAGCERSVEADG